MKTLDLEQMSVYEMEAEEMKNINGGDRILDDIADALVSGVKWNLRAMSWGLYVLSE